MQSIVLTGGGTAGHCIPNIALIPYLKKKFNKIYYIGSENGIEKQLIEQIGIPYFSTPCAKFNRSITLKNFAIPFKTLSGYLTAGNILDKLKPNIIFSKGGYVSIPTILAGHKRSIPIISHESDFTPGLANKISARFCKKVLTSFPETALMIKNGLYVGPPIKQLSASKIESLKYFGFSGHKPIILITGGSLGAQTINNTVTASLPILLKNFDVLHICGKNNISNEIRLNGYVQKEFVTQMEKAYAVADVCVSRAGSNTVFELLSLMKPCLLIPLAKSSSRGDQIFNAKYFLNRNAVSVLFQESLTSKNLIKSIEETYKNRKILIENISKLNINNSCEEIVNQLDKYSSYRNK